MSQIDELRQNFDDENDGTTIDISNINSKTKSNTDTSKRVPVNVMEEFPDEPDPNLRESLVKDILEGDSSPFSKYLAEKTAEMEERMATFDLEKELAEEESGLDGENFEIGSESVVEEKEDKEEETDDSATTLEEVSIEKVKEVEDEIKEEEKSLLDDEELEIVEEDDQNVVDQNDVLKNLQKLATEKLKPKHTNLSSFTILKKPTANIKKIESENTKVAKWVAPSQDSIIMMKEFLGSELENLREYSEDNSSYQQLYRKYKIIYDHIASDKPATYEAWLKSTPFSDLDHYFFAAYIASFKDANYIPMDCKNKVCKKTFISDDVPFMNMVKFATDEAKEKFDNLMQTETNFVGKGIYVSEVVSLNDKIAVGFKDATVYNLFEIASLSNDDRTKYSAVIDIIPYIDAFYIIDHEKHTLEPIGYKIFPDNANKTIKSKIITFNKVLKTLSVDEFAPIKSFIRNITGKSEGISYVFPSVECPHCGKATEEQPITAEEAVFLRYQLSSLVNTSLK